MFKMMCMCIPYNSRTHTYIYVNTFMLLMVVNGSNFQINLQI